MHAEKEGIRGVGDSSLVEHSVLCHNGRRDSTQTGAGCWLELCMEMFTVDLETC